MKRFMDVTEKEIDAMVEGRHREVALGPKDEIDEYLLRT